MFLYIHDSHRGWRKTRRNSEISRSVPTSTKGEFHAMAGCANPQFQGCSTSISDCECSSSLSVPRYVLTYNLAICIDCRNCLDSIPIANQLIWWLRSLNSVFLSSGLVSGGMDLNFWRLWGLRIITMMEMQEIFGVASFSPAQWFREKECVQNAEDEWYFSILTSRVENLSSLAEAFLSLMIYVAIACKNSPPKWNPAPP